MKVVVLYRPNSEHERAVNEFTREFERRFRNQDEQLELVNIDSRDGNATAMLYDIMRYPAILVIQNDGYLQKSWEGDQFPLLDEVFAYAHV